MNFDKVDAMTKEMAGKAGLRSKVNAKCLDCTYDPKGPGNWRQQVAACTVTDCPLWTVRPRSQSRKDAS